MRDQNRRDFVHKTPGLNGFDGFALRGGGKGILVFATDAVLIHKVLCGDAHVVIIECIPQAIADHGVDDLAMAHAQAGSGAGHDVVGQAHVFLAACDDHVSVATTDGLGSQMQRFEPGAADFVERHCWHGKWQAGLDGCLACRVLTCTRGEDLPHDDFIDLCTLQTGFFEQLANDRGAQVDSGYMGQ